jgi:hypothetical protein
MTMHFLKSNIVLFVFALSAFILVILASGPYNLGVTSDSVYYIEVSRNIKSLAGVVNNEGKLVQHWPPFYPVVLAASSSVLCLDCLDSGKYLNAVLIAIFFFIFNLILRRNNLNIYLAFTVNLLLLISMSLQVFIMFWSEGLFLMLLLGFIFLFLRWSDLRTSYLLIVSGLMAGLMVLTKYAGIGFVAAALLYLLFFCKDSLKNKSVHIFSFIIPVLAIVLPWIFYTLIAGEGKGIRKFAFHPADSQHLNDLAGTFNQWLVPEPSAIGIYIYPVLLSALILLILIMAFKNINIKKAFSTLSENQVNYLKFIAILAFCYIFFLFLSISFFDAQTPMNNRILSPLFPLMVLIIAPVFKWIMQTRSLKVTGIIIIIVAIISQSGYFYKSWHKHFLYGTGYTSRAWKNSGTLKKLEDFRGCSVYTNGVDIFKLYEPEGITEIKGLPMRHNPNTLIENPSFNFNLTEMKMSVETGDYVLIYFEKIRRSYLPGKGELLELFKGFTIIQYPDGFAVFRP